MELYLSRVVKRQDDPKKEQWIRFPIESKAEIKIGRSSELPVRLLSAHISRNHAVLNKKEDKFFIMDLKSLNGVHVNDQRINADTLHVLKKGDKVEIGRPDTEEVLKTMDIPDRFIYLVKAAATTYLDEKLAGPRQHVSSSLKRHVIEAKNRPNETKGKSNNSIGENNKYKNSLPNTSKGESAKPHVSFQKEGALIEHVVLENQPENKIVLEKPQCVKLKYQENVGDEMVQENKRLKLELERKERELIKEREERSQKLRLEQEKLAKQYEKNYKNQLEQKEEELEIRLQLEKDIAIEQCKSAMPNKEASGKAIAEVVDAMENELQCSICSELFIVATTLNCAHTFCQYCISEWRKVKSECPVCRTSITTVTRSLVLDNYIDKALSSLSDEMRENRAKLVAERLACVAKKVNSNKSQNNETRHRRGRGGRGRGRGRVQHFQPSRPHTRSSIVVISDAESSDSSLGVAPILSTPEDSSSNSEDSSTNSEDDQYPHHF